MLLVPLLACCAALASAVLGEPLRVAALDPLAQVALAERLLHEEDGPDRPTPEQAELTALVLEGLVLEGRCAEVEALLVDPARASLRGALGAHAACVLAAARARPRLSAREAPEGADALERYRLRGEEVRALEAAGLHASARAHALAALSLLADADRPDEQLRECERLLAAPSELALPLVRGALLARLGEAQKARYRLEEAVLSLREAAAALARQPGSPWYAFAEDQLGWACSAARLPRESMDAFRRAEKAARATGDHDRLARVLRSLAAQHQGLGELDEAVRLASEAARVAEEAGLRARAAESLLWAANFLALADEVEAAGAALERARVLAEPVAQGSAQLELLRLRVQRVLELRRDPAGTLSAALAADCERLVPRLGAAHLALQPVTWLATRCLRLGELERAREWIERADRLCGDGGLSLATPTALRALYAAREGRLDEALAGFESVLRAREQDLVGLGELAFERRFQRLVYTQELFHGAVRVAAEAYEKDHAARYAYRALRLLDHARLRTLRQLLELAPSLGDEPGGQADTAADFHARYALAPDALLLAFDVEAGVAIACLGDAIRLYRIPGAAALEIGFAFARHALLEEPTPEGYAEQARRLGALLLGPIQDWLRRPGSLLVLDDGPLHELPLEFLLVDGDPAEGAGAGRAPQLEAPARPHAFAELPFVFRWRSVVHAACLPRHDAPEPPTRYDTVLAFAYAGTQARLDATAEEPALLARIFGAEHVQAFEGEAASEARLRAGAHPLADVLHLGAHVVADRERGGSSYVELAPGEGQDGRLRVRELVELALSYRLVVVSGCEGAAGQPLSAEGLLSVGWGLLAAGARAVLVSTSPVEDALAPRWMRVFYARLRAGDAPADALRETRLRLLAGDDPRDLKAALLPFHLWRAPR